MDVAQHGFELNACFESWGKHGLIDGHGWIIDMPTHFSSHVHLDIEKDRKLHVKDYYAPINLYFLCYIQMVSLAQRMPKQRGHYS
jgi:hypothetical protein